MATHVTPTVRLRRVGSIELLELRAINESVGRDVMPFPFIATRQSRFTDHRSYTAFLAGVPDRFTNGDLSVFQEWFAVVCNADLRVECRLRYLSSDRPSERLLAHRKGQLGFFAKQRTDEDVIEVFSLPAYDLGGAIAGSVELTKPGAHPKVVIPDYVPQSLRDQSPRGVYRVRKPEISVPASQVKVHATVQSRFTPARAWGMDQLQDAVVWIRLDEDGDYIYTPDYRHATPMSRPQLHDRVDRMIAADLAVLRHG